MTSNTIGVIVGRFHVGDPHNGHQGLIRYVKERHSDVLIVLGVPATYPTDHDPLPYELRRTMLLKQDRDLTIAPLQDMRSNESWSKALDGLIRTTFPERDAVLYGSRDSFRDSYSGSFETSFVPDMSRHSGTAERERIQRKPSITRAFRKGVIYATVTRPPITYPTVDIGIYRRIPGKQGSASIEVLLGRKPHDPSGQYRFIGGFVDPTDASYEAATRRERSEESGDYEHGPLQYVGSHRVDDWRYRGTKDGIMTILFRAQYIYGSIEAADDIETLQWFALERIKDVLVEEHRPLGNKYLASFATELTRTNAA